MSYRLMRLLVCPLLVAVALVGLQAFGQALVVPSRDEFIYLSVSRALSRTGVFTDGLLRDSVQETAPGRFITPAYPAFISLVSRFDVSLATAIECYGRRGEQCGGSLRALVVAQAGLAAVTGLLIFLIAWRLSEKESVAWITMVAALASGEFSYWATRYTTETLSFAILFSFLYLTIRTYLDQSKGAAVLAGLVIGMATLTRPMYLYLFYAMAVAIPLLLRYSARLSMREGLAIGASFVAGSMCVLLPWMSRNYHFFGDMALTKGYAELSLVTRIVYNSMSWPEVLAAAILWLPGIGEPLAKLLFAPELYQRLGTSAFSYFEPLYVFKGDLFHQTLAAAGSPENHLSYLLKNYVWHDLLKHTVVTLLLTLRGMWVGKYLALMGLPCTLLAIWLMNRQKRLIPFLLFLLPLLFLSFLYGFSSVSIFRYHIPMIAVYAFAIAVCLTMCRSQLKV